MATGLDDTDDGMSRDETARLIEALGIYRTARLEFLDALGCASNRDPLAGFSERLVAAWLGGTLAANRVQKGWDLTLPNGETVEVRYLANPADRWVNEHHVRFPEDPDELHWYALAIFEGFELRAVFAFPHDQMATIGRELAKRHPDQDRMLQLTRTNYHRILTHPERFETLGMRVLVPTPPLP